jgi:hypothetical protein
MPLGMFVRFRQQRHRLQASLIVTHWAAGKPKAEHIGSLGSVDCPPSVRERLAFWGKLPERLAKLDNRVGAGEHARIYASLHARIPMVTPDEQRAVQAENFEADERFWASLRDMNAGTAEEHRGLAKLADEKAAAMATEAAKAEAKVAAAKERRERIERGEDVAGGLGKPQDIGKYLRDDLGWTQKDIDHCVTIYRIHELGGEPAREMLMKDIMHRTELARKSAVRNMAKLIELVIAEQADADQIDDATNKASC